MITQLSLQNFKGNSGSYSFRAGNYIHGRNASGKSAIDQGIRAAILGYIPGHKETVEAIRDFASDFPCSITLSANVKGAPASGMIAFERKSGKVVTTAKEVLASLLDPASQVLFNPSIFFGLSDKARIAKAIELVSPADVNRQAILDRMDEIAKDNERIVKSLTTWKTRVRAIPAINDLLTDAATSLAAEKKALAADEKTMSQTTKGLTDLSTNEKDADAKEGDEAPLSKPELQGRLITLEGELRTLRESLANAKATNRQIALNEQSIATHKTVAAGLPVILESIKAKEAALAEVTKKVDELKAKVDEADAERMAHNQNALPKPEATEYQWDEAPADTELNIVAVVKKTEAGIEIVNVQSCHALPTEEQLAEHDDVMSGHYLKTTDIEMALHDANDDLNAATAERDTALAQIRQLESAKSKAEQASKFVESITTGRTAISEEQIQAWEADILQKQSDVHTTQGLIDKVDASENDRKRAVEAAESRDKLKASINILSDLQKFIAEKAQEILSLCIDAPLAIANDVGAGIMRGKLVFQEGELGMLVGDKFISSKTFSGSESSVVVMGLCAGLASKSALRTLVLDEVGTFDNENAARLISNLAGLVEAGHLSQWIVIGPTNPELAAHVSSLGDSATVIEL